MTRSPHLLFTFLPALLLAVDLRDWAPYPPSQPASEQHSQWSRMAEAEVAEEAPVTVGDAAIQKISHWSLMAENITLMESSKVADGAPVVRDAANRKFSQRAQRKTRAMVTRPSAVARPQAHMVTRPNAVARAQAHHARAPRGH